MNLRNQLPGGLTLEALEAATAEQIDACICKVGFHNTKCARAGFLHRSGTGDGLRLAMWQLLTS